MDARKTDRAPLWLLSIAATALGLSLVATRCWIPSVPTSVPRVGAKQVGATVPPPWDSACRKLASTTRPVAAPSSRWIVRLLPPTPPLARVALAASAAPPWSHDGGFDLLIPGRPLLSARPQGNAAGWLSDGRVEQVREVAWRWLSRVVTDARVWIARWAEARRSLATAEPARSIASPPVLMGPVLVGPGDRLAMATRPASLPSEPALRARTTPRRSAAQGDQVGEPASALRFADPRALRQELESLAGLPATSYWVAAVMAELDAVVLGPPADDAAFDRAVEELAALAAEGLALADQLPRHTDAVRLRRAALAIQRRTAAWRAERRAAQQAALTPLASSAETDRRVRQKLQELERRLAATANGAAWRQFLRTETLDRVAEGSLRAELPSRRLLADDLARRLAAASLSAAQQEFIRTGPVAALADEVRDWAAPQRVDVQGVASRLESYELDPTPRLAAAVAADRLRLAQSGAEGDRALAERIDRDYRGANVRVAVSAAMIERWLPEAPTQTDPVRDTIAGAAVTGLSTTRTKLRVRLEPHPSAWVVDLVARGRVDSHTYASSGPATLRTLGGATFEAHKRVGLSAVGVHADPARCDAAADQQMVGMATRFDGVPLVGNFVRSYARDEYASTTPVARAEVESRVRDRVARSLDERTNPALTSAQRRFREEVLRRGDLLGLRVTPLELSTTPERVVARVRVAGDGQLAAHTPRNRAPEDSALSLQLHESALNNALEGLALGGQRLTGCELRNYLAERLDTKLPPADGDANRATLHFASADPVRLRLDGGRIEMVLALAEIRVDRSRFSAIKVHAFFLPEATLAGATVRQEGPVQIEGRLRPAERARLHAVMGKVLPPDRVVTLLRSTPEQRQRLEGLMVTQLVVDGGWLGVALGPAEPGRVAFTGSYAR